MKSKILAVIAVMALPLFLFAAVASAHSFRSGDLTSVASGEVVDGTLFMGGANVNVAGTVNGDLFCGGQNITISGTVNGDVLCGGQTVTIFGTVTGDVRVGGQTVNVGADIGGSLSAGGQTILIDKSSNVGRDASLAGQNIQVDGEVGRDLAVGAGTVSISADVERNVNANIENLSLVDTATVYGDLTYTSPRILSAGSNTNVLGEIDFTKLDTSQQNFGVDMNFGTGLGIGFFIAWTLMLITSAVLIAAFIPRELHNTTEQSVKSFPKALMSVFVGLVAGIFVPVALFMMMVTVLGIPFAIVAAIAWVLILSVSGAFSAYYLGRVIWRRQSNAVLTMIVGSTVLVLLLLIPIVNIFVWLLSVWFGTGAILLQLKKVMVAPRYNMKATRKK